MSMRVCIIGGGLAGITAGLSLARSGVNVVLLEADDFTQYRAGEHIAPQSIDLLRQLDVPTSVWKPHSSECFELKSSWGGNEVYTRSSILNPSGGGLALSRPEFDKGFLEYSVIKGLKAYIKSRVVKIEKSESKWKVMLLKSGSAHTIWADWILDASGRNSKFMQVINVSKSRYDKLIAFSSRFSITHSDIDFPVGCVQIKACHYGWWYACRFSEKNLIISLFTDSDIAKQEKIRKDNIPILIDTEDPFQTTRKSIFSEVIIRAAHTQTLNQFSSEQWIAIGDAAWSADPLSSQGMYKAIVSGNEAVQALLDYCHNDRDALVNYNKITRSKFLKYLSERSNYYLMEQRWANSDFWARRHYPTWMEIPVTLNPFEKVCQNTICFENREHIKYIVPEVDLSLLKKTMVVGFCFSEWIRQYKSACSSPPSDKEIIVAIQELML